MTKILSKKKHDRSVLSFLALLVLTFVSSCQSGPHPGDHVLQTWQISHSRIEDPTLVLTAEDWTDTDPTVLFRLSFLPIKDLQSVWLHARIDLDHPRDVYGLSLGRVYMADRVYVNGRLCGETGHDKVREFHDPRYYRLPQDLLKKGENRILVRLGIYGQEYGGFGGEARLLSKTSFHSRQLWDLLVFVHIPFGVMSLSLGMLVVVVFFSYERGVNGRPVLILSGIIVVWLSHLFMIYSPIQPLGMEIRINYLWLCSYINSLFFILFIQASYRHNFKRLNCFFVSLIFLAVLATLIWNDTTAPFYPGRSVGSLVLLVTNLLSLYMLMTLTRLKGLKSTGLFWIFGYAPSVFITLDILNYLYGSHVVPLYHVYVIPMMNVLVILLYRRRLIRDRIRLKYLTETLNRNDSQTRTEGKKTGLTPQVEIKLRALKDYIAVHYASPLTRDSLAEKMAMSPDYMSRMFKTHEGVKINDYINVLRVNEACRLLRESNLKIIDIAFAVGFESLATFNRAFIRQQGIAPSEYRLLMAAKPMD